MLLSRQGDSVAEIVERLGVCPDTVRRWIHRFDRQGVEGLADRPRAGRPPAYSAAEVGAVIEARLTKPQELRLPFACWTLNRLAAYLNETKGTLIKRSRIGELLDRRGLALAGAGDVVRRTARPSLRRKKVVIVALYEASLEGGVVIWLDELGPESVKSVPGTQLVCPDLTGERRVRAKQASAYGRRGKGNVFGAFRPSTPIGGKPMGKVEGRRD